MRYLHTMVRVRDLPGAVRFFCEGLGLREIRRRDSEKGRFTLVFLGQEGGGPSEGSPAGAAGRGAEPWHDSPQIELTYNWDNTEPYAGGRNFGHVAYEVEDIYAACQRLVDAGYPICRPPRDGHMAFVRSPDLISVELLQRGAALAPAEPWSSAPNVGEW